MCPAEGQQEPGCEHESEVPSVKGHEGDGVGRGTWTKAQQICRAVLSTLDLFSEANGYHGSEGAPSDILPIFWRSMVIKGIEPLP